MMQVDYKRSWEFEAHWTWQLKNRLLKTKRMLVAQSWREKRQRQRSSWSYRTANNKQLWRPSANTTLSSTSSRQKLKHLLQHKRGSSTCCSNQAAAATSSTTHFVQTPHSVHICRSHLIQRSHIAILGCAKDIGPWLAGDWAATMVVINNGKASAAAQGRRLPYQYSGSSNFTSLLVLIRSMLNEDRW